MNETVRNTPSSRCKVIYDGIYGTVSVEDGKLQFHGGAPIMGNGAKFTFQNDDETYEDTLENRRMLFQKAGPSSPK